MGVIAALRLGAGNVGILEDSWNISHASSPSRWFARPVFRI
jgi:hypothetical protein